MLKYVILLSALLSVMPTMAEIVNMRVASGEARYYKDFLVYQTSKGFNDITENQKVCFLNKDNFWLYSYTIEKILKDNFTEAEIRTLRQLHTHSYSFFAHEFMRMGLTPEQALEKLKNRQADYVFNKYYSITDKEIEGRYQEAIADLQKAIDSGALQKANQSFANTDAFNETQKARFNEMIAEAKQKCRIK
ncbi:hypothetical protein LU290_06585 [Moraxella nasibovis]|uniref:hypothetical protein n=1 Tax=Moraxella nasibovis TaxID=2904120 RepID=UPI00240FB227|nr:hypothetical protein [Moraxella nasibovis]WFF37928.1 hypothetical protein LU290_06585 [Moraxella nasibovis]